MSENLIVRIQFGSHLYGTSTPASDLDFKSIYLPSARDILLGQVKSSISTKRPKAEREKNFTGEIDEESYSLLRYLGLLAEGQTVALDVLFAPRAAMPQAPTWHWDVIVQNRHKLVTRKSSAFVGYCRQQANKYGIKGSRVAAARAVLAILNGGVERFGPHAKLREMGGALYDVAARLEHVAVIELNQAAGARPHLEVCNRKLPFSASIGSARDIVQRLVDDYGHLALQAERQEGVDWKALSHAVRVATQALELMSTGHVTFPLPNAAHIMAIKTGGVPYAAVAEEIERLLVEVEAASSRSTLPDEPDRAWIDDFVVNAYGRSVRSAG